MVTAIARRRPAKLARESVTVDRMSNGRLILGVGLGADEESEFELLGEDPDARVRAQKLDEGLELLTQLWSGKRIDHRGRHFRVKSTTFIPRPVQTPRIPIWVGGWWPNKAPFRRALRWDGFFPTHPDWPDEVLTPDDYRAMRDASNRERGDRPFDLVVTTTFAGDRPTPAEVSAYEEAGVTWWVQGADTLAKMRETIRRGPPL
jgi:alkanesulfonate monooxygenase SsuD/methylene tetrahydromethanopterin reductase-like flavin-dependent oxidoreductase (luciferase family)